ncbi:MAG: DinB family protein [Armatimonadota bacterium]|nr:DinB family protein [Armatimonadota bacterium]MDR7450280.1 DinB family protein [Armatimonadota bacterium]MDR7467137.1 DinB family protein [Armatimonadota bacterium]MDR7493321.1 DinB family protein [Armatimonadota bacterium]MDR7499329.1 DinB family protein [Armatimonadota bacterium]
MTGREEGFTPIAFYEYLVVARRKLLEWVRPLTLEQYTKEFPFGRRTVRDTLVEIPLAEWSYGTRLAGEPMPASREGHPFTRFYSTAFAPLEAAWEELADRTRRILREERDWGRRIEYRTVGTTPPMQIRTTAAGVAIQMMTHEVHHRAQVMAMLRQLGANAQNLDYSILMFERRELPA